jgi:hypothetical protein
MEIMAPAAKPAKRDTSHLFLDLSDSQADVVNHDVQMAKHICVGILSRISARSEETLSLLHMAFGLNIKSGKEIDFVQDFYRKCGDGLGKAAFKADATPGGMCVAEGFTACVVSDMKGTIVLSSLENMEDYFSHEPLDRSTTLIHEFAHMIGLDSKDHPGGVWEAEVPPSDGKPRIAWANASHNAHCYGNFAYWVAKADKILQ